MLYARSMIFINGELHRAEPAAQRPMQQLADARQLPGRQVAAVMGLLYQWYRDGYICLSPDPAG
jgi:hypothetical protein